MSKARQLQNQNKRTNIEADDMGLSAKVLKKIHQKSTIFVVNSEKQIPCALGNLNSASEEQRNESCQEEMKRDKIVD